MILNNRLKHLSFKILKNHFIDIDTTVLEFIWSTSQNPTKFSKHLTVKGMYFDDWIKMSRIFYKLFCEVWDISHDWISSKNLVDFQIVRNKGSLRMVGSTKINGYPLVFDNKNHCLPDSLIRIYFRDHRRREQLITRNNLCEKTLDKFTENTNNNFSYNNHIVFDKTYNDNTQHESLNKEIYSRAFEICDQLCPGIFRMGKITGLFLSLIRKKPFQCLLSNKLHEQENAFLKIYPSDTVYVVSFGCYRHCSKIGTKNIDQ